MKSAKTRASVSFSRTLKATTKPAKDDWRVKLKDQHIFNINYSFDVLLLVESSHKLCATIADIEEQGEESTAVKFLTPASLIKFLNTTCTTKPEYDYYGFNEEAFTELQEEYTNNQKLSPESLVHLIKLRILAYNEVIAHDRELIRQLKYSLEQEMRLLSEQQQKEKDGGSKRGERKMKMSTMKQSTLDYKYLQMKSGKMPNFMEMRKVPTIYNTDYDEPDPENIYYVLSGFYDPTLIQSLQKSNIPILSLIEFAIEGVKNNSDDMVDEGLNEADFDRLLTMRSFWRSLIQEKSDIPRVSKNSCYVKYAVPDPATQKPSFDNFLMLLKNLSDLKRLYYHYFTTVRFLNVAGIGKPVCLSSMNNYNAFLDQIPNECITIPLILHALVDEVCVRVDHWKNEKLEDLLKRKKVKRQYHGGPVVQVKSLLREYDCSHKKAPPIIKMPKAVNISYGNTLEYINAHVPVNRYIDTVEISLGYLRKTLPLKLFQKIDARNTFDIMFYNYVFTKWSEQLVNVSAEELTLCVYAYLFTRGNFRKFVMPNVPSENAKINKIQECMFGVTKVYNEAHNVLNIKLNTSFFKAHASVQSDPINDPVKNVLENETANSCDNLSQQYKTLAQDLDTATFIQMINVAYSSYNHFDYKYFAPTDVILLRFHYTNAKCGFSKKKQQFFLRTPLCFRDFCYKLLLQDCEWFLDEEKKYWKGVYVNREKEKEYLLQHPKVDNFYDPIEFIIPGSIKHELSKTRPSTRKSVSRKQPSFKDDGTMPIRKSLRKSRESSYSARPVDGTSRARLSITVPTCEPYNSGKEYAFEIYNLGQHFYPLEFEDTLYQSGILSVKLTKQQLPRQPLNCTFVVSSQDTNLVLHCEQDGLFKQVKPLHFNVNMTNGIVMVFSMPTPPSFHIENRHVVLHKANIDETKSTKKESVRSISTKATKSSGTDEMNPKLTGLKNEVLQYLSIAMKEQLPVFKIISSRLHKYQYVKRIKSKICLPIGNIYRRVCCKPTLYKRLPKNQNVYEGKCIPYSDFTNKERSPIDWKWNCSLPTGLAMETVQANIPHDFYIRQRYVIERTDLPSIQDEAYRCYLRCGIIMKFLKDGSIKTLSPDKTLSHYKYGYFSSNKNRVSKNNTMKDVRLKRQTNIIPLHAYRKNLSALEEKVRKISIKYKKHLIDIADNYRFESSRADSRKMHKIYKLSKKIYTKDSHVIPLINHSVITAEGRFIDVKNNVVHDTFRKYEETRHRDYLLNETVTRREDGTAWMIDKDGNSITQFPDGSRIKTWYTILDENLIVRQDPAEYKKSAIPNPINTEETESLTKFCQTGEEYEANEEEDVELLFNKESNKEQTNNIGFVLVGMNYSFEHPNFATVSYYCWEESSADILMADNVTVTAFAEGTYKLKLINSDTIHVNNEDVKLITETTKRETCLIKLAVFTMDKPKPEQAFLTIKENDQKVFIVTCDGQIMNKKVSTSNTSTLDTVNNVSSDRMFVMKRDLSGIELIKEPIPYNFVHTLIDLKHVLANKNHDNVIMGPTKMKIFQPLRKTYSEHLMMMYDVPILATTKERQCLDKLWKLHDLDISTILGKRSPLVIFERYISYLPTDIIVEQVAQAVLKCIIEGNENLPNINLIQELIQTEESVAKPETIEEKVPSKKYIPKRITCKKQLDKYKALIKDDSIPRYFETVRGLMFLAVEECSEGAMEESSTKVHPHPTTKKTEGKLRTSYNTKSIRKTEAQEIEEKLDRLEKENIHKKSEALVQNISFHKLSKRIESNISNAYPAKLNIPERLSIHLKPNAPVHEIILTANGLQIITDKNVENYYYNMQEEPQHSALNNTIVEKSCSLEKEIHADVELNQKYQSSSFGEDIGCYFDSAVKLPSWDDSLCQKTCINSFSTSNTLITIPEQKPNERVSCHQATCACSVESIQRLAKCCKCKKYYCNCKDTYSMFATCSLQNELKISEGVCVLATKIIQTIEKDAVKFSLLHSKLETIIKDTANVWSMPEPIANDLIKTLKWIIENKIRTQNTIPEEQAINIVKQIEAGVSKIKISNRTVTLSIGNLQKMADLVLKLVCNSKNNVNIVKEIKKLLGDAQISRLDIIDTLKLAKEKIHLYYEHGLYPDLPLPEIPPDSKCCKIARYVDYLLDSTLEVVCEKCNSRSILNNNISIHNTSPVNQRSKESFETSGAITQESLNKKHSPIEDNSDELNSFTYKDEEIKDHLESAPNQKPNIIVEPFNYTPQAEHTNADVYADDDYEVNSTGGYSLVKSCEEIVDVSIPFINKKSSNLNVKNNDKRSKNSQHEVEETIIVKKSRAQERVTDEEQNELSKLKFPSFSETPTRNSGPFKEKDIITIMAPDHESCVTNEYHSSTLLSPLLYRNDQKTPKNDNNTKPIVYDGNIVTK